MIRLLATDVRFLRSFRLLPTLFGADCSIAQPLTEMGDKQ
jgi:hypothetical protein